MVKGVKGSPPIIDLSNNNALNNLQNYMQEIEDYLQEINRKHSLNQDFNELPNNIDPVLLSKDLPSYLQRVDQQKTSSDKVVDYAQDDVAPVIQNSFSPF